MQSSPKTIYSSQFILLCTSSFLFFASFGMIIPELPAYLESMGGGEYKGAIISLFTLAAGLSRPFSGKLADKVGRLPVIFFGVLVSCISGLFYPILVTVNGFLLLRFLHGFSTGFTPTGTSALVADIVPVHRRGEAMGVMGLASNIGTAFGPALGSEIAMRFSINAMFYAAAGFGLFSVLILLNMQETLKSREAFRWQHLNVKKHEIIEPRVLVPSLVMLLSIFGFGVILTLVPDLSDHLGLKNKGLFFSVYTISSLAIRFIAGKVSDRFGRAIVLQWSLIILVSALLYIAWAPTSFHFLSGAALFGVAVGMSSPTIFAWTIDLGLDAHRGRAIATMFIALELGIGLGALSAGALYSNDIVNISYPFYLAAGCASMAWLFLTLGGKRFVPEVEVIDAP